MPGDSTNLNIKAKTQHTYDAIIVGSGISGGWAAKELCERGLKVLLLERGSDVVHPQYPTATKDPWKFAHRLRLTVEEKEQYFVPCLPLNTGVNTIKALYHVVEIILILYYFY